MVRRRRAALLASTLAALSACSERAPSPAQPKTAPLATTAASVGAVSPKGRPGDFNVLATGKGALGAPRLHAQLPQATPRAPLHVDSRLGVPTFLWGQTDRAPKGALGAAPRNAVDAARDHLRARAAAYGLSATDVDQAVATQVHDTGTGAIIVTFRQSLGGIEVFREAAKVAMDRRWNLVAISGNLSPAGDPTSLAATPTSGTFALGDLDAIAVALSDVTGEAFAAGDLLSGAKRGAYLEAGLGAGFTAARGERFSRPARAKKVWFRLPGGLEAAYYVEVGVERLEGTDSLEYGYVISAADGRVLFRKDQVAYDQYKFRVWADAAAPFLPWDGPQGTVGTPHPTGTPDGYQAPFLAQADVTLQNSPFSRNDPWLPTGATETTGNNAEAYADISGADGFDASDIRGVPSAPGEFAYTYDFAIAPNGSMTQVQAAISQLFYDVNFFHDWYYDVGFDEASGNAQAANYGRGGLEGDSLRAEAQDFSGSNNANMRTPADGGRPRMQMYLFSGNGARYVTVNSPAAIAGTSPSGTATFGPTSFDLTKDVVLANDGSASPTVGCATTWTNAAEVAGKIALVYRGTCAFSIKAKNAQLNGAVGVIISNNVASQLINMSGSDPTITIPALSILKEVADGIVAQLPNGPVNLRMARSNVLPRDGTLDNAIVAHEWGHYISNRLIGDAAGLDNQQGGSMGEGWGDFHALLLMVRAEDAALASNPDWAGVYGAAGYVTSGDNWYGGPNDGYYFGIRRVPYSTDLSKDPLTFKHTADGNPIGQDVPISFGWDGTTNSEVHNAGEVWATMLWECYASLLRTYPFDEAQARMKGYLVAAYKLTPTSPTFLEARDAVLAAAYASSPDDYKLFWAAFAKRGAGMGAVAADRYAGNNGPVVESYVVGPDLQVQGVAFGNVTSGCDDGDAVLDSGETGTLTVTIRNTGDRHLGPVTAAIASADGRVSWPDGGTITFPASDPFQAVTGTVRVALGDASGILELPLTVTFPPEAGLITGETTTTIRANTDEVAHASATDDLEADHLAWSPAADPNLATVALFERVALSPVSHVIHGPDAGAPADLTLTSPSLQVAPGASLSVSFRHAWSFEADPVGTNGRMFYDGAVIELSTDGGQTWTDVGTPLYSGTITAYSGTDNPLAGRAALVGDSAGWPDLQPATLDLGSGYGGQTVLLRFRTASDAAVGFAGWYIDDVKVAGITNTPFPILIADTRQCVNRPPTVTAGAPQSVPEGTTPVALSATATDPDSGTTLTYHWTQVSGPAVTLSGTDTATPTFTAPPVLVDTDLVFQVTVSDGALSASATQVVTDLNTNRAPLAVAGVDYWVDERSAVVLDASRSADPDGNTLAYAWTQTAGPAVVLSGADTAMPTFTAPEVTGNTDLTFELTVSDGLAASSASVTIHVRNVNRAPVASAGSAQTVNERTVVTLHGSGTDPDGDALTYQWAQTSGPAVTLSSTTAASPTFTAPAVTGDTTLVFQLTVRDGAASSTSTVAITVKNVDKSGGGGCSSGGADPSMFALVAVGLAVLRRRFRAC